jgi:hypothetical protein
MMFLIDLLKGLLIGHAKCCRLLENENYIECATIATWKDNQDNFYCDRHYYEDGYENDEESDVAELSNAEAIRMALKLVK